MSYVILCHHTIFGHIFISRVLWFCKTHLGTFGVYAPKKNLKALGQSVS